jgi:3-methyladenine DNA glycosylase AlkC
MPRRKKAYELTTEQALRRLFPKEMRKALKQIVEQSETEKKSVKRVTRKAMKR